ncbi:telomere length regulation protein-domain-containing protein [Pseudoneurospora amorphoporcata]|uniref:Telomere length regulation protein-domain-containing protein n=1 Tax=Pseudoneurospora amorphoporcata TaxID=241081 RepID=A0AAN6P1G4_9PEZI|nr:telomere length regulation protein-domain-containing protein [Pseudoneurospora amorphoporcata]
MDGLLTPISTSRLSANKNEPLLQEVVLKKDTAKSSGQRSLKTPEEALDILRHEPDYDQLVATLRFINHGEAGSAFSIKEPSPMTAKLVQVLVTEIVPNYWTLLNEDPHETKSSALGLLLSCLRSLTGVNAIIVSLRALLQETQSGDGKPKRPDVAINIAVLLNLACLLLKGDDTIRGIWIAATRTLDGNNKTRMLSQEILATFGSGRILSLTAEALEHAKGHKAEVNTSNIWLANGPEYIKWLSENIVKWQLTSLTPAETKLCSDLFLKTLRLGHSDAAMKCVITRLLLAQGAKNERFGLLLGNLPRSEQRKVLFSVLKTFAEDYLNRLGTCDAEGGRRTVSAVAGAISSITKNDPERTTYLVEWLTGSSGAGLGDSIGIRRAVVAVVSQDRDSIVSVLEKSIAQFGDQLYVKHSPMLQQEVHAQVLLLSAGYVHKISPLKLTLLMRSSSWLNAISNRLSSSNQRARFLGMVVGEGLSSLIDKGDKRLNFQLEETELPEGKWYKSLVEIQDTLGSWDSLFKPQGPTQKRTSFKKPSHKPTPSQPRTQGFIIEELSDEELSEQDDIVGYGKPDSDAEDSDDDPELVKRDKAKAPVYIRDLIRYLRDTDDYDRQKLALATAPTLIRRKANYGTEVTDHAEELASLLIGLQDKFEMDNFDDLRLQAMIAIVVAQPQLMGQWFAKTFFAGDYSVSQRSSILAVLGLSARELAGFETSEYAAAASFPSKSLPEKVERLFIGQGPSNAYQSSSSSLKPLPRNALESVATSITSNFLAPLSAAAADSATGPDVLKLSTFKSRLSGGDDDGTNDAADQEEQHISNPKIKIKSRTKPRIRAIPNTTAHLICTSFFNPLTARFQVALHSSASRIRGIMFQPHLLALYLKTLALLLHAAGPSTLALPQMTGDLWRLLLSTSVRAQAVGDVGVTQAVLFGFLTLLDLNEDRMRDVCQELGKEVVETEGWVAGVFEGLRGGDEGGEEERTKMMAAGVLVRLREGVEKYRLMMVGDLIGL